VLAKVPLQDEIRGEEMVTKETRGTKEAIVEKEG
jgi:hypothetical protein